MKNVHRIQRGNKVFKYHRKTRARLPDLPENHPDFIAAWMAEEQGTPKVKAKPGTLSARCEEYLLSSDFKGFSKGYARRMRVNIDDIRKEYGHAELRQIEEIHIENDLEKLDPHAANMRLKTWRKLLPKACRNVQARKTPKSDGFLPWSVEQFEDYRNAWPIGTMQRAAGELLFWTGARTNDAVTLSRAHVGAQGLLTYRQSKTGAKAHVPWTSELPEWAPWQSDLALLHDALKCCKGFTFLETPQGARSAKGLSNLISAAAKKAGIDRSAHGLRKTRLTLIAEAGGPTQAIMAWGGHLSLKEAEHYTRDAARQKVLFVKSDTPFYKRTP